MHNMHQGAITDAFEYRLTASDGTVEERITLFDPGAIPQEAEKLLEIQKRMRELAAKHAAPLNTLND